jgi:hypothetical protein
MLLDGGLTPSRALEVVAATRWVAVGENCRKRWLTSERRWWAVEACKEAEGTMSCGVEEDGQNWLRHH